MKVRLKHTRQLYAALRNTFQFHEGPIKTDIRLNILRADVLFQFHEGPIKTTRSV